MLACNLIRRSISQPSSVPSTAWATADNRRSMSARLRECAASMSEPTPRTLPGCERCEPQANTTNPKGKLRWLTPKATKAFTRRKTRSALMSRHTGRTAARRQLHRRHQHERKFESVGRLRQARIRDNRKSSEEVSMHGLAEKEAR
jgi:hypothetical protein